MRSMKTASKTTAQLLAEYSAFPNDQPINEQYAAVRLQKSRSWMQLTRVTGGGPRFHRTTTGKIYYIKSNVEAYLSASLTSYESTSQYPSAA